MVRQKKKPPGVPPPQSPTSASVAAVADVPPTRPADGPRFRDIVPFVPGSAYRFDVSLDRLPAFIDDEIAAGGLDLRPDFQRPTVWTEQQQSAYLEFFLRGGSTGRDIYFNCPEWSVGKSEGYRDFVLVDGLQRLTAVRSFVANRVRVFGHLFADFADRPRRNTFLVHVNTLQSRADVLRWYISLNSGTPHTEVELRRVEALLAKESAP